MLNKNHNQSCDQAENLIAVLYGEASQIEKTEFALHQNNCDSCRVDLALFGTTRSVLGEWRENDFLPLELPEILLPEPIHLLDSRKPSWTERLRGILLPGQFGWQNAAAFGAIAVCATLVFIFAFSLENKPEKLEANSHFEQITTHSQELAKQQTPEKVDKKENSENPKPLPVTASTEPRSVQTQPVDAKGQKNRTKTSPQKPSGDSPKLKKQSPPSKSATPDIDIPAEDPDDNAPRLTDLLDEVEPSA